MKRRTVTLILGALAIVGAGVLPGERLSAQEAEADRPVQEGEVKVMDRCCWDLDGGGRENDGVFVVSRGGGIVVAMLYEDPDGNGRFDGADEVLAIATPGASEGGARE